LSIFGCDARLAKSTIFNTTFLFFGSLATHVGAVFYFSLNVILFEIEGSFTLGFNTTHFTLVRTIYP